MFQRLKQKGYIESTGKRGIYSLTKKGRLKVTSFYAEDTIENKEQLVLFIDEHGSFCKSMTGSSRIRGGQNCSSYYTNLNKRGYTCVSPDDTHQWLLTDKGKELANELKLAMPKVSADSKTRSEQIRESIRVAAKSEYITYSMIAKHYGVKRQRIYQIKQKMDNLDFGKNHEPRKPEANQATVQIL